MMIHAGDSSESWESDACQLTIPDADSCRGIPSHFVTVFFSSTFFNSRKPVENSSPQETESSENKPTPEAQLLIMAVEREWAALCLRVYIHW
jgi:hypothetical protein